MWPCKDWRTKMSMQPRFGHICYRNHISFHEVPENRSLLITTALNTVPIGFNLYWSIWCTSFLRPDRSPKFHTCQSYNYRCQCDCFRCLTYSSESVTDSYTCQSDIDTWWYWDVFNGKWNILKRLKVTMIRVIVFKALYVSLNDTDSYQVYQWL